MRIIDCFIFYNEVDLLKYRLKLLKHVVDTFVIVESNQTFIGSPKELYLPKELLSEFNVIHIVVDFTSKSAWENEKLQRNAIEGGVKQLQLHSSDVLTITDLDEIPDPEMLQKVKSGEIIVTLNSMELDLYYYNLQNKIGKWLLAKILKFENFKEPEALRRTDCPIIPRAGWHLSYFGNPEFIANKIKNFSHQEYNSTAFTDIVLISERVKNKKDLFNRPIISLGESDYRPPNYPLSI